MIEFLINCLALCLLVVVLNMATQNIERTTYGTKLALNYGGFKMQGEYIYDEGDYKKGAKGECGFVPLELGKKEMVHI
mgnify:FL=1|tara:strand:- start:717 stop:950 length:234 start_codon:yes stop_codon:yes gene_type:complete